MAGTTPKARAVGAALRKAREAKGITVRRLGEELETSHTTVSRWETGQRSPKPEEVAAYLVVVGASAEQRDEIIELARDPDGAHWLSVGMPEQQRQLTTLLEVERTASRLTVVSMTLVPGLLQTGEYARAIMLGADVPANEVDTRVAVRLGRRDAITRAEPAELNAFVWEPVLRQRIGGKTVARNQVRALQTHSELDNVHLRVIPMECDWHPGLDGTFSIAEFADRGPMVHLENRVSGLFLHEPQDVEVYRTAVAKVADNAMSESESSALIAEMINRTE
ncbi:helix-turn-helix protein [Tamaricihabitans halophyticus]|uniref:Helix-turn-helix protein n=1 Tax=Tamaricihabitans halophyticus TaxID=1262583 RepID=A0A4R2QWE9_9PSEU|nr:helix-turn-helix transcriptional regulator [Tamaricihabitans halophyticus]TCP53449.1 helix-turn-helix protein [Tamaricihabitans halophyticus]